MNPENQPRPAGPRPVAPGDRMSRKTQALLGLALFLIGLVTMGVALAGAIGGAIAGGCCGGHGGGSSGSSFWTGAGFVASGFGLAMLLAAALAWRTVTVSVVYFGAVGLFMGFGVVSDWSHEREAAKGAVAFMPWRISHDKNLAAIHEAMEADDPVALETASTACLEFIKTVPPEFQGQIDAYACGMAALDYSGRLDAAFKANAWRILDHSLEQAQQQAQKSGSWRGTSVDPAHATCFAGLAERDDDAPWLMKAEDRSTTAALRESGTIAKPQGPVPTDMLRVLANHRTPPLRAGEGALQRLFGYALYQRRMDIVQAISRQVNGRFAWCSEGGAYAHNLVSAISLSSQGRAWKEGEAALFQAIASWPQEPWREVANIYLGEFTRSDDTRPRSQTQAACQSAAARIAALRSSADRASLIETCRAS